MFGGAAPAGQKAIQFKVDMALVTVSSDSVHVAVTSRLGSSEVADGKL